jgi:hypothetical protein
LPIQDTTQLPEEYAVYPGLYSALGSFDELII